MYHYLSSRFLFHHGSRNLRHPARASWHGCARLVVRWLPCSLRISPHPGRVRDGETKGFHEARGSGFRVPGCSPGVFWCNPLLSLRAGKAGPWPWSRPRASALQAAERWQQKDSKSLLSLLRLIGDRKPPSPETICGEAMTLKSSQPQAKRGPGPRTELEDLGICTLLVVDPHRIASSADLHHLKPKLNGL